MKNIILVIFSAFLATSVFGQDVQELGDVNWLRNYDQALEQSAKSEKPVLILFQEVPGCSTCRNYGDDVLSNPLVVDVIEHYFVPLAIYNNKGGADKKILDLYNEPTWNNPVVRIVDQEGKNLIKRINGNYSSAGLVDGMIQSFTERGIIIPQDIRLLQDILSTNPQAESTYSMFCFWSGERTFGKLDGVYSTTAGWQNGREVVKVVYDPNKISERELTKKGKQEDCADDHYDNSDGFRKDKDPKYYLKNSKYRQLAMHPLQAARINSLLGQGVKDVGEWLFPTQKLALENSKNKKSLYDESFEEAWEIMKESIN